MYFPTPFNIPIFLELFYLVYCLQLEVVEAPLSPEPGGRRGRAGAAAFERGGSRGILRLLTVGEGLLAVTELRGDGLGLCYLAFLDI